MFDPSGFITLEKGIPMPEQERGPINYYPWHLMKAGDSFLIIGKTIKVVSGAARQRGNRKGEKYRCRTMDGGVRVWRVK